MASSNYSCSQPELYVVCRNGWDLCRVYLPVFTAYKSKYSSALVNEYRTAMNVADALADSKACCATAHGITTEKFRTSPSLFRPSPSLFHLYSALIPSPFNLPLQFNPMLLQPDLVELLNHAMIG
ncbi:MAG: hypothetical protein JNL70_10705 [Saprospiraceae bacterium]|nr:hypothetical protein [Saprospiraceae bacterium]